MRKRGLVLGGGGTLGIAWEIGLAAGLLEGGVNLGAADLIVGTSAGSAVGTQLAAGFDPRIVMQVHRNFAETAPQNAANPRKVDPATFDKIWSTWASAGEMSAAVRRELGALALAAPTEPEESYIGMISFLLGVTEWPAERDLRITAVDAGTGDFVVFDRAGVAPIATAVAASCCVPGLFPPVTIGGRRFVDGGVRSGTNADLAAGCDAVVIIAPLGERQFAHGQAAMAAEIAGLREAGAAVELILPDAEALAAFGPDMMAAARVLPAAEAGFRQGQALVSRLAPHWCE